MSSSSAVGRYAASPSSVRPSALAGSAKRGIGGRRGASAVWIAFICLLLLGGSAGRAAARTVPSEPGIYAEFDTPRGLIVARLFYEQAPLIAANFVGLAEGSLGPRPGRPYFNGLTFHRVVPGFVVQGGDPLGTGEGGPGYTIPDQFSPGLTHDAVGVLSMANNGPDNNGSQFFFTLAPAPRLDYLHSVFGKVVSGLEVLSKIQQGDRMRVSIRRVGQAAAKFDCRRGNLARLAESARRARDISDAPPHFADPDGVLPTDVPRAQYFDTKLVNVERAAGKRLYARLARDGADPMQAAAREAAALGLAPDCALAVYIVSEGAWGIWTGDGLRRTVGAGSAAEFADRIRRRAELLARSRSVAPPAPAVSAEAENARRQTDAMLQALVETVTQPGKS